MLYSCAFVGAYNTLVKRNEAATSRLECTVYVSAAVAASILFYEELILQLEGKVTKLESAFQFGKLQKMSHSEYREIQPPPPLPPLF
jgi:hypothetical protein